MSDVKMKFTIEMKDLKNLVNFVRNGLGNSKTDLSVMLMRAQIGPTAMTLFASDKEITVRGTAPIKNAEAKTGSFAMLGNKLEKLISQVDTEFVNFSIDSENVEVVAGYLTVNFELYQEDSLVSLENTALAEALSFLVAQPEGTPPLAAALPRAALQEGLECAKACSTTNSIRPDVTHAELRGGRLLSSDGRKIMILTHDAFPKDRTFKVQAVALNSVSTALKNLDMESVSIAEGKSYYYILGGSTHFISMRKIERGFPAVEGQIANSNLPSDKVAVDKLALEAMIKGVALGLATEDVKVTVDIAGTAPEAYVEVSGVNTLGRRSHERASCGRTSAEPISFPISFQHLLSTLGVFKGDSIVDMLVMQSKNLLMVRDSTPDREVLTIIPFRTQAAVDAEKAEAQKVKDEKEAADKAKAKAAQEKADAAKNAGELKSVVSAPLSAGEVELEATATQG